MSAKAGAVVVAAGRSSRLPGALPKPFLRAGRRSLLGHVLAAFAAAPAVGAVVVVTSPEHLARARRVARPFAKVRAVVSGGARRQDSVAAGVRALPTDLDPVLVHDAARPLLERELIQATVEAARRHGGAIAASPVVDTLKRTRNGRVVATVNRAGLWRAETPQAFRRAWLLPALAAAERDGVEVTDDAMLVERLGRAVRVVPSRQPNFKVTTPGDLALARALLAARKGR